jgi:serine/threonine protein kinase
MYIRCPSCRDQIDVAGDDSFRSMTCPACGSTFSLLAYSLTETFRSAGQRIAHFELLDQVGVGAFGVVYKARDTVLDRTVALKVPRQERMDAKEADSFFREARASAQIKHPSIVSVYEVGRDGSSMYIASEFVQGATLAEWMDAHPPTQRAAAELMAKVADAVHCAHERGVIHRDLKPSNILIDERGEPHVTDFGLAKRDAGEITVTLDGQILGTPAYMSPEQARGEGHKADARSDVYSLGVVLYCLLTGKPPFEGSRQMLLMCILQHEPTPPRSIRKDVHRDLETICLKCLEKDPARRYPSAAELRDDLGRFVKREPIKARRISSMIRISRSISRNPTRSIYGFMAFLGGIFTTWIIVFLLSKESPEAQTVEARDHELRAVDGVEGGKQIPARRFQPLNVSALVHDPAGVVLEKSETYQELRKDYERGSPSVELQAKLATAAWWTIDQKNSPADSALARKLTLEVARDWRDWRSGNNIEPTLVFSLYYTLLLAHAESKDDAIDQVRLDAAREIVARANGATLDESAGRILYSKVLAPLESVARRHRDDAFFADTARLIKQFPQLNWDFQSAQGKAILAEHKVYELYTAAIVASEARGLKIGEYYTLRQLASSRSQSLDHNIVPSETQEPRATGIAAEGFNLFLASRSETAVSKRYEKLNLAMKTLERAEEISVTLPQDEQTLVLYYLSLIHTERGNLADVADAREKIVPGEEFKKAIAYAEKVIAGGGGPNLQYAHEAAANAYEDLAWHARVEPEKNFNKAIEHLTNSVTLNRESPSAHMALARAHYKMIVEAGINRMLSRENLGIARREIEEAIRLAGDGKNPEAHLWAGKVIQATHVDEQTSLEEAQKRLTAADFSEADEHFRKAFVAAKEASFPLVFLATYAYAWAEHALFNPELKSTADGPPPAAIAAIHSRTEQLGELKEARTARMDPEQEAKILRANADLLQSADDKTPIKVLESLEDAAIAVRKKPPGDLTRSDVKLVEFRFGLQAKLRPDQLAGPIVKSAVRDALWYSKTPPSLAWKDRLQGLLTAQRLSQQLVNINMTYADSAADDQAAILQRIIDMKLPPVYDFKRHIEIVNICIRALQGARSLHTASVHLRLRQVTKAYLQDVVKEAARLKRPATETAALENFLKFVSP